MTYEQKIEAFRSLIINHNLAVADQVKHESEAGKGGTAEALIVPIEIDRTIQRLVLLGGSSLEGLKQCSYEDLEGIGLPKILAKQAAALFRSEPGGVEPGKFISPRAADRMSYEELLSRYTPQGDDAISHKLKELGKGSAFIVFLEDGGVDVPTSVKLLDEIRKGFGGRPTRICVVEGSPREIFSIGQKPDNYVDENPLYPGRALRPDGTCDQLNRSWAGVPLEVRQLIRLIEVPLTIDKAHELLDIALEPIGFAKLTSKYSAARLSFEDLKKQHRLPLLRIELGKQTNPQSKLVTKFH